MLELARYLCHLELACSLKQYKVQVLCVAA